MSALKIDWETTSGKLYKSTQLHTRITTTWSVDSYPGNPNETKIISLSGSGHINSSLVGTTGGIDPFNVLTAPIPFEIASRYVEDCLAKNTLIDLTGDNIPKVIAQYGSHGPARHDPPSIGTDAKKTLG